MLSSEPPKKIPEELLESFYPTRKAALIIFIDHLLARPRDRHRRLHRRTRVEVEANGERHVCGIASRFGDQLLHAGPFGPDGVDRLERRVEAIAESSRAAERRFGRPTNPDGDTALWRFGLEADLGELVVGPVV